MSAFGVLWSFLTGQASAVTVASFKSGFALKCWIKSIRELLQVKKMVRFRRSVEQTRF